MPPIISKEGLEAHLWQPQPRCRFHHLQPALAMNILSRLNTETLLTCRCVCKSWLRIISDPQFSLLHHARTPIGILIHTYPPKSISRKVDFTQIVESPNSHFRLQKLRFTPKNSIPISEFNLRNSCNGLLLLSGPDRDDPYPPLYVCNPILGEYLAVPPSENKGRPHFGAGSAALGFSIGTSEYKVLRTFPPLIEPFSSEMPNEAEIYTIGSGVWRRIGTAPGGLTWLPFNAFLHGALHWIAYGAKVTELIGSFNFEREQFRPLPPPGYFGPIENQCKDCLKLGVLGGCLLLCVFGYDSSKFNMWVMKEYGVQESWTKTLVVENLYPRELSCDLYEPMVFLSNGEIILSYNDWIVVCYNQERKSLRDTKITRARSDFHTIGYSPCFVSLYNVSKGEEVKRVKGSKIPDKLFAEGSYDCAGSGIPPHKTAKLNSDYGWPAFEGGLPRSS